MSVSDLDGITTATKTCKICRLKIQDEYMIGEYCKPYHNFKSIQGVAKYSQNLFTFAIIYLLLSIISPPLRQYSLYVLVIAFLPMIIMNQLQIKIHYKGIPNNLRVVHMLRMYQIRKEMMYYSAALHTTQSLEDIPDALKTKIAVELVDSVVLNSSVNPFRLFEEWSEAFDMDEAEFVGYLFDHTSIMEGFSPIGGTGLLPDVLHHVTDENLRVQIFDELLKGCEALEVANENEKLYFLQDLYLVIDDIEEELKSNPKYEPILQTVSEFEPEEPPKNAMMAMKKQMEEAQRQSIQQ